MLYLVATPIGNLGDISKRAITTLLEADIIYAEDTRSIAKILSHIGAVEKKILLTYNEHSPPKIDLEILTKLQAGQKIALVSDAGMPLISDPGARLVRFLHDNNASITVIPGPSAVISALAISGLCNGDFFFAGFLPPKKSARMKRLEELSKIPTSLVLFESPKRLIAMLTDIATLYHTKQVAVIREITKIYEEVRTGVASELLNHYSTHPPKGEIVVIIDNRKEVKKLSFFTDEELMNELGDKKKKMLIAESAKLGVKILSTQLAESLSISKQQAYRIITKLNSSL